MVTGAISLDSVKKRLGPNGGSLSDVFRQVYGPPGSRAHTRALGLFTESCAAWAVVAFLLQVATAPRAPRRARHARRSGAGPAAPYAGAAM